MKNTPITIFVDFILVLGGSTAFGIEYGFLTGVGIFALATAFHPSAH